MSELDGATQALLPLVLTYCEVGSNPGSGLDICRLKCCLFKDENAYVCREHSKSTIDRAITEELKAAVK